MATSLDKSRQIDNLGLALKITDIDATGDMTVGDDLTVSGDIVHTEIRTVPANGGKVGATAGWATNYNDGTARLPASQTTSTWTVGLPLNVGETLTAVWVNGQVESAGNNVTLVMSVRKGVAAAADFTDSELATDNVGTLTADTKLTSTNLGVTGLTEVLAADEYVYVLLTGTTAASTDIALGSIGYSVTTI